MFALHWDHGHVIRPYTSYIHVLIRPYYFIGLAIYWWRVFNANRKVEDALLKQLNRAMIYFLNNKTNERMKS